MSKHDTIFKGDVTQLANVDIDIPLADVKEPFCRHYVAPYGIAAQQAEERGDTNAASTFRFLQVLVSFSPNFDNPQQPFVPRFQIAGIHAGFHGDFVLASHLLVPQIENSLRYVLESQMSFRT